MSAGNGSDHTTSDLLSGVRISIDKSLQMMLALNDEETQQKKKKRNRPSSCDSNPPKSKG
jgi:hypothetical protein